MGTVGMKSSITLHSFQTRNLVRSGMSLSLRTGFLIALLVASTLLVFMHANKPTLADVSFSFSAAGDYGETKNTTTNLKYMGNLANSGAVSFNLALGDLNYDSTTVTAEQWICPIRSGMFGAPTPKNIILIILQVFLWLVSSWSPLASSQELATSREGLITTG